MKKSTIATLVAFAFIAAMIAGGFWNQTHSGGWAIVVGLCGGALVTGILRFIAGRILAWATRP